MSKEQVAEVRGGHRARARRSAPLPDMSARALPLCASALKTQGQKRGRTRNSATLLFYQNVVEKQRVGRMKLVPQFSLLRDAGSPQQANLEREGVFMGRNERAADFLRTCVSTTRNTPLSDYPAAGTEAGPPVRHSSLRAAAAISSGAAPISSHASGDFQRRSRDFKRRRRDFKPRSGKLKRHRRDY